MTSALRIAISCSQVLVLLVPRLAHLLMLSANSNVDFGYADSIGDGIIDIIRTINTVTGGIVILVFIIAESH